MCASACEASDRQAAAFPPINGHCHWILWNAKPLPFAPVRGKLSLFEIDHDRLMRAALVTA
jgi:hypothetical protein